jgi:hypothetical protein
MVHSALDVRCVNLLSLHSILSFSSQVDGVSDTNVPCFEQATSV